MNKEEFDNKIKLLEQKFHEEKQKFHKEKQSIYKEFAFTNSSIIIGDIVEDHKERIKVEEISFIPPNQFYYNDYPQCIYKGICLTKSNKPFKNNKKGIIFQSDIINTNDRM